MGCHTWVYKIATQEEIDTRKSEMIKNAKKFLSESKEKHMKPIYKVYCKTDEDKKDWDAWYEWRKKECLKIINDGVTDEEAAKGDAKYVYHNDKVYIQCGCDTPFRLYGYPEETFTDKNELLDFLKKNEDNIGFYRKISDNNYEFTKGYTLDLVNEVMKYYEKYGEDNLYFSFG